MKKLVSLLIPLCLTLFLRGQSGEITGHVTDSTDASLVSATVVLLTAQDSIMAAFTLTDGQGRFQIKNVKNGQYILQVTYVGYENFYRQLEVTSQADKINLGRVNMQPRINALQEVVVSGERIPLQVRKDTLVFNADAFKTRPNAKVEDLLKKLPGVEVERDGTVKAQGEQVNKVLVDGKEFFGDDPKIATRNLPAEAVDQVKIFDKRSDMAEFSGIDDGQRDKTIDLVLDEDKKQGHFGDLKAGYGDRGRFEARGSVNKFTGSTQLSLIGMANNVNEQGFSIQDYLRFSGGLNALLSAGGGRIEITGNSLGGGLPFSSGPSYGYMTSYAGGLNFNHEFSKKTELNGSYFFNRLENDQLKTSYRESFLDGGSYFTDQYDDQLTTNSNHRFNMRLNHDLDSLTRLRLYSTFSFSDGFFEGVSQSRSFRADQAADNISNRDNNADSDNMDFSSTLYFMRRFNKPGRFFTSQLYFRTSGNDNNGFLNSVNQFNVAQGTQIDTVRQDNLNDENENSYRLRLSYTEPLTRRQYLEFNYEYQKNTNDVDREVYDLMNGSPIFNSQLSNRYQRDYTYSTGGITFRSTGKNYNLNIGASYQHSDLTGDLILKEVEIDRSFDYVLPSMSFSYEFGMSRFLRLNYRTNIREPSVLQLQPIVDNTDPLNIYIGNPELKPAYNHSVRLGYHSFSQATLTNLFANVSYNYTANSIVESQTIDQFLVRTRMPVNVGSEQSIRSNIQYGAPTPLVKLKFQASAGFNYGVGTNFINNVENETTTTTSLGGLKLENRFKEVVDMAVGFRISYTTTEYSISREMNQDYVSQSYYTDLSLYLPAGFTFNSSFDYAINRGVTSGFEQDVPLWNVDVSKTLLPSQRLQLSFRAVDILNENLGVTQNTALNYIENVRTNALGRYFLLSLTYSLSGFKRDGAHVIEHVF